MTKRGNQRADRHRNTKTNRNTDTETHCKRTPIMITQTDGRAHVGGSIAVKNT